jgi:hypothetical protein
MVASNTTMIHGYTREAFDLANAKRKDILPHSIGDQGAATRAKRCRCPQDVRPRCRPWYQNLGSKKTPMFGPILNDI